jgi:hypothetical protein
MDFDDKYIVVGFGNANNNNGALNIYKRSDLTSVFYMAGDDWHRNLGRDVAIKSSIL